MGAYDSPVLALTPRKAPDLVEPCTPPLNLLLLDARLQGVLEASPPLLLVGVVVAAAEGLDLLLQLFLGVLLAHDQFLSL